MKSSQEKKNTMKKDNGKKMKMERKDKSRSAITSWTRRQSIRCQISGHCRPLVIQKWCLGRHWLGADWPRVSNLGRCFNNVRSNSSTSSSQGKDDSEGESTRGTNDCICPWTGLVQPVIIVAPIENHIRNSFFPDSWRCYFSRRPFGTALDATTAWLAPRAFVFSIFLLNTRNCILF